MGRPAKFDRRKAVEEALQAFWRDGYETNSVKALSERFGMTRSSFYNAFVSQEALFREALELYCQQSPDHVLQEPRAESDFLRVLNELMREICRLRAADPDARGCLILNTIGEFSAIQSTLCEDVKGLLRQSVDRLAFLLEQAALKGDIALTAEPRTVAMALQNLIVGLNMMSKVVKSEDELWKSAEQTLKGLNLYQKLE